ncbi:MAG: hypothetical protein AVDCRST_MAG89-4906, partial [uncultured Gemmatimonadetes bacterium]
AQARSSRRIRSPRRAAGAGPDRRGLRRDPPDGAGLHRGLVRGRPRADGALAPSRAGQAPGAHRRPERRQRHPRHGGIGAGDADAAGRRARHAGRAPAEGRDHPRHLRRHGERARGRRHVDRLHAHRAGERPLADRQRAVGGQAGAADAV